MTFSFFFLFMLIYIKFHEVIYLLDLQKSYHKIFQILFVESFRKFRNKLQNNFVNRWLDRNLNFMIVFEVEAKFSFDVVYKVFQLSRNNVIMTSGRDPDVSQYISYFLSCNKCHRTVVISLGATCICIWCSTHEYRIQIMSL